MKIKRLDSGDDYIQYLQLLSQLTKVDIDALSQEMYLERLQQISSNPLHNIYVLHIDDVIVATITVLIEPKFIRNLGSVAHIEDVVILEEYRSKGLGKLMVQYAIDVAKEKGCYKVILDCSNHNNGFYHKLGFEEKGSQMAIYF